MSLIVNLSVAAVRRARLIRALDGYLGLDSSVVKWMMEKQIDLFLGNAILSGIGLAFAMGAPAIAKVKSAKKWWIVLWVSFLVFYLWSVVLLSIKASNLLLSTGQILFNGLSAAIAAMLYLHLCDKWRLNKRKAIIFCCFVFMLSIVSGLLSLTINGFWRHLAEFGSLILLWAFFVLLAWNYRKQHMATTILLLAYANLQLPASLVGKGGWVNDFVLLLAAKLSLIGAMYHTLGVRDAGK